MASMSSSEQPFVRTVAVLGGPMLSQRAVPVFGSMFIFVVLSGSESNCAGEEGCNANGVQRMVFSGWGDAKALTSCGVPLSPADYAIGYDGAMGDDGQIATWLALDAATLTLKTREGATEAGLPSDLTLRFSFTLNNRATGLAENDIQVEATFLTTSFEPTLAARGLPIPSISSNDGSRVLYFTNATSLTVTPHLLNGSDTTKIVYRLYSARAETVGAGAANDVILDINSAPPGATYQLVAELFDINAPDTRVRRTFEILLGNSASPLVPFAEVLPGSECARVTCLTNQSRQFCLSGAKSVPGTAGAGWHVELMNGSVPQPYQATVHLDTTNPARAVLCVDKGSYMVSFTISSTTSSGSVAASDTFAIPGE
jgi:hypothetical protein